MNNKPFSNYIFENDIFRYESFINEFTPKLYKKFDLQANKSDLISKINNLLDGKIVNQTENQAALHTRYRSGAWPKNPAKVESDVAAFLMPHINNCITKSYTEINIIMLGIGGSYEGPKLLLESFNRPMFQKFTGLDKINYDFITGSDPIEFEHKTRSLNPENTFFVVSSKSFTTDETIQFLRKAHDWSDDKDKFIAITANPNEAKKYGIKKIINFDKEIGGRYSIWSPIIQLHLCGDDVLSLAKGGHQADIDINEDEEYLNFIKRLSFSDIYLNNIGKSTRAILSYIWNLRSLPNYFQQLEMESLGKPADSKSDYKKTGQIIFGGYGPIAQHSYFQLLHQGTHEICADIIANNENKKSLAYAQAITQSKLLSRGAEGLKEKEKINGNIPINLFLLNKLDPYSLGYLIASWEHRTYITAVMLGINPFDQYGVEAGKNFTREFFKDN